jgi:hypothetical protein
VAAANPAATIAAWLLKPLLTALHCTCWPLLLLKGTLHAFWLPEARWTPVTLLDSSMVDQRS